jgi:hypothetical protein
MSLADKVSLADNVRRAARQRRLEASRERPPGELQRTAADDLSAFLGVDVDPAAVTHLGYVDSYYVVRVRAFGLSFIGNFTWGGGDHRYALAGHWTAVQRVWLWKLRRELHSLADLEGWV